ncbi:haloacid dehalogenase [Bacillus sp. FJAT-18017]|uniref:Cof-type HAD-IIB family hydrolase n=1 Tax=Bacillus sp. FJAT-18017 TaxID=1705566 RepID=UPI0006AE2541|nr:Cof-type HAD-IIB family hydrolase [Bacillus sp. FJAT-18017]ALC91958.1 haloacid dehalogenase [Bacillus sp. FJAT-18017]
MIYRMLALNIDGTLVDSAGKLHKSTKEAISYVQNKGICVTLVTSRNYASARKVAKALKLKALFVSHQGAYIANADDQPVYVKRINEDLTYEITRFLESFSCQIRLVHEKFSLANKLQLNNNLLAKAIFTSGDPLGYSHQFVTDLSDSLADTPVAPPKIEAYFESEQDLEDARLALKAMFTEVKAEANDGFRLDIVPSDVSKLSGLLYICDQLGISCREVVAIGDSQDDIPFIEAAGLGVAMGNAPYEVKRAADWVTRAVGEHGVAYMVKEHFRKQHPIEFLKKMNIIK